MRWWIGQTHAAGALLAAGVLSLQSVAPAAGQVSHVVAYDVQLDSASPHEGVRSVAGEWTIELRDQCDGWATEDRLHLITEFVEGGRSTYQRWLTRFESADGRRMTFDARETVDGVEENHVRGDATLAPGAGTTVRLRHPEPRDLTFPPDLVFPTRFLADLLAHARRSDDGAGDPLTAAVFEGASDLEVMEVSVIVGEHQPAPAAPSSSLLDAESWRISIAYYHPDDPTGIPWSEAVLRLYDTGVADDLVLIYPDLRLAATLVLAEALDGGCP